MKLKTKLSNKTIGIISIVSVFAMLIGIVAPITADYIAKGNAEMANATERATTSIVVEDVNAGGYSYFSPKGNSVSEDISGLAFAYKTLNIDGITFKKNSTEAIYDNATAFYNGKDYPLLGMGAIVHNKEAGKLYTVEECDGKSILNVPIKYIFNHEKSKDGESDFYTFAVRITNIPKQGHNTHITAIPYFTINMNGKVTNMIIYESVRTRTFNEVLEGKTLYDCPATLCYMDISTNSLCFVEAYDPPGASYNSRVNAYVVIPNKAGNMVNKDRLKIDIDANGTITVNFTCRYHNEKHVIVIPKECRYHL